MMMILASLATGATMRHVFEKVAAVAAAGFVSEVGLDQGPGAQDEEEARDGSNERQERGHHPMPPKPMKAIERIAARTSVRAVPLATSAVSDSSIRSRTSDSRQIAMQ